MRWLIALVVLIGATGGSACGHSPSNPATALEAASSSQTRVPGEYLITLAPAADIKAITDLYGRFEIKRAQDLGHNIFLVTLTNDPGLAKMEELRRQDARI